MWAGRGRDGSPHARGQRRGKGGSRTAPTGGGVGGNDGGRRRASTRDAPTGEGLGGMMEGRAVWSVALAIGGGKDGGRGRAPTRDAPTGDGVGGNDGGTGGSRTAPTGDGGRGWVPASARTTERGGRFANRLNGGRGAWRKERGVRVRGSLLLRGLDGILLS